MSSRFSDQLPERSPSAQQPAIDIGDLVDESIIVFDTAFRVSAWNAEAERLYGWRRDDVLGRPIQSAVRCAPSVELSTIIAEVEQSGTWRGQITRSTKYGETVIVEAKWSLRRGVDGAPIDIVETSRDATDSRRMQEAFLRMQFQYQSLFQASVASFWELDVSQAVEMVRSLSIGTIDLRRTLAHDPEIIRRMIRATRVLDVNERTVALFGSREYLIAGFDRCWPDASLPIFSESVVAAVEGRSHFSAEVELIGVGGERLDTLFTVSYPPLLQNSSRLLVGITDITQTKRAKVAQERSERRYRDFFHFLPIALLRLEGRGVIEIFEEARSRSVVDFDGYLAQRPELIDRLLDGLRIVEVNQRTVEMLRGRSAGDFTGSVARYWTESRDVFCKVAAARYSGKKGYESLVKIPTHEGSVIDALFFAAFAPVTGEEHVSLVGLIDVSDRVRAQEMFSKLQADIAHATRVSMLGELTASIAHEVSQPLTAIEANTEASQLWLLGDSPNLAEVRELCRHTAIEVQRAADIVHRVRSMAMRSTPKKEAIDVNSIIEEALLLLRHEMDRSDIETSLQFDTSLSMLFGDRVQLQQVIVNLSVNAIQSMSSSAGVPRKLTIRTRVAVGGATVIEVEDTGPGIRADALPQLFDGFFTTKEAGMGIGLAICRSIIESHGGRIEAANREDHRGARFRIIL